MVNQLSQFLKIPLVVMKHKKCCKYSQQMLHAAVVTHTIFGLEPRFNFCLQSITPWKCTYRFQVLHFPLAYTI